MVLENLPSTRASRSRRHRAVWPRIIAVITLAGAVGGLLLAAR
jgi:L-rhamnose mutarotase